MRSGQNGSSRSLRAIVCQWQFMSNTLTVQSGCAQSFATPPTSAVAFWSRLYRKA